MQGFRSLKVWQKGHQLTLGVYKLTVGFPREELYGVISQLRRAAAAIPANIAEGCGRGGDKDFARFVQMAMGSASELEYFLLLSRDLHYCEECQHKQLMEQTVEIKKMLTGLLQTLKGKRPKQSADSKQLTANN